MGRLRYEIRMIIYCCYLSFISTCLANSNSFGHTNASFGGVHLKFGVYSVPPFMVLRFHQDGNYTLTGSQTFVFQWLADKLKFKQSFVPLNDSAVAQFGSSNALLLQLVFNHEVDGAAIGQIATLERLKKFDSAYILLTEPYAMVVPRPSSTGSDIHQERLFAFVKPFQAWVWILLLIVMIAVVGFMTLFSMFYFSCRLLAINPNPQSRSPSKTVLTFDFAAKYAIYVANTLTNHGERELDRRGPFRILLGVWLLGATVLVNSYSSTIIAFLTVPTSEPIINSFEDLAASNEINLVLFKDVIFSQQILEAKMGIFKFFGDQARENPGDRIVRTLAEVNTKLLTERYAHCNFQSYCKFFVADRFKREGRCRFRSTDPLSISSTWSLFLQKDSKWTSSFNIALMELWESGLASFWLSKDIPATPKCFEKIKTKTTADGNRQVPIRLTDLKSVFFILGSGVSLSLLVFVFEVVIFRWEQYRRRPVAL